jgi:hypothetical protein
MILDKENLCSDKQAVTVTAVSTNAIDLWGGVDPKDGSSNPWRLPGLAQGGIVGAGSAAQVINDPGRGEPNIQLFAQVDTATFTGGTSMQVQVITSAAAALSSPTVLCESAVIALASLVAGYQFRIAGIPAGSAQRYLGFNYVVVGTMATGTVTAGLALDKQTSPFVG